jgi:bacterioferritin (cytochrome b1)
MSFVSFTKEITELVQHIVSVPTLHGLWLNTLSYLENCGARKIASCEHPTAVKEEMLKHAAEEFRHAFYLKTQLTRIGQSYEDYRRPHLLGGWAAYHYLNILDVQTSRYLRKLGATLPETKQLAYLLVTYAIELRAGEMYPIYQAALRKIVSRVQVQSILLEEEEHLNEMEQELGKIPSSSLYIEAVCQFEARACALWLKACYAEIFS